ncbi:Holliday junction branch migration DNA helicase RuvB [Rickettsia prowazekii]|uniref:Holliday junction branch migration complex subunit RuvB n=2 Tax=Rickettsia prowazekii TaxID=782 RepID=RUVB_RICPR|nr:Holliday junction branch migration DNA helicase RuvB [Rickettsia prowazekii]Q9ZDE5.1 RecName: Full=Holliday junction branch migration complex subunit RuvB [Rickettsia prowazekii str. Madrid E]ADE29910.1 Holliday junction DNA helicase RuvB [Rickettsia prowazekii str. Rp22]AFE49200.1 Holliday junction DNA helicase RuvB [Rickettsia prowazekii str. Chernikova]AFE50046.1 Holliday junction DNA helicase RuvB [Rickettsia prowazekii str. Katsinyian]AFE50891.1 Holliday junction DNA helicase RuvB [Ric
MTNILSPEKSEHDQELPIRPSYLKEFVGQQQIKENLLVFIKAAKSRNEHLDHTLFYGPPGLGKTTLAKIISNEIGGNFKSTAGPAIIKAADLASILTNLEKNDVLFIDEIHRLNTLVEEVLYSAMEDFELDIIIGEGSAARPVKITLPKFTLIGATTRFGLISNPLRDRFGIPMRLNFYNTEELKQVLNRASKLLDIDLTDSGSEEIAKRSRGTPRIALRLLRRIRDFAVVDGKSRIDKEICDFGLKRLTVDSIGLDSNDYRYLKFIADNYHGGPVGIETIAAALSEQRDELEETIEPYLIKIGLVKRTPRGRVITIAAFEHLKMPIPNKSQNQLNILNENE